jgi:phosphate acetyltransferase
VGLFRPVSESAEHDDILEQLLNRLDPNLGLTPELCVGVTYDEVHADSASALATILQRYDAVASRCDVVVVLGSDFTDVGNPAELDFNARVAANLGAPILLVLTGLNPADRSARTPAELAQVAASTLPVLRDEHAQLLAVVVNRVGDARLDEVRDLVGAAVADARPESPGGVPVWCLPENKLLNAPSVAELRDVLGAELYSGDETLLNREVLGITVSGMSMEHVLERTFESGVVVVASDRTETIVALLLAQQAKTMPSLAALVVNGPFEFSPIVESLIRGVDLPLPMLRTQFGTYETAQRLVNTRGRFLASMERKVDAALADFAEYIDAEALLALLDVPEPTVVTPLMFEHTLLARARGDRQHIVLPEGNDDRILQAASTLLTREVADLTILGDEAAIQQRASALGLDLSAARILSPQNPELLDRFAEEYARPRARRLVLRHDDGAPRPSRRHGVGRRPHDGAHDQAVVRDREDEAERVDRVERVPHVARRPGTRLRRLRGEPRPDCRAARRHRDLVGRDGAAVQHRATCRDAQLLDRRLGRGRRRRQGARGDPTRARARPRAPRRRAAAVRRGDRHGGRVKEAARQRGRRPRDRVHLPRPQHRQ